MNKTKFIKTVNSSSTTQDFINYSAYEQCKSCSERNPIYDPIRPYRNANNGPKIMFIGQDPTIRRKQDRVKCALMLDEKSQISKWLKEVFAPTIDFDKLNIYATNLVKCILNRVPTDPQVGGIDYLLPCFEKCKRYLLCELMEFKPDYVFTLGEPAHQLFMGLIENRNDLKKIRMQDYFKGSFIKINFGSTEIKYSPLLHIQGYRVAKKYGDTVRKFEYEIENLFKSF